MAPPRAHEAEGHEAPFELAVDTSAPVETVPPPIAPAQAAVADPHQQIGFAPGAQESLDPRTSLLPGTLAPPGELSALAKIDPTAAAIMELLSWQATDPAAHAQGSVGENTATTASEEIIQARGDEGGSHRVGVGAAIEAIPTPRIDRGMGFVDGASAPSDPPGNRVSTPVDVPQQPALGNDNAKRAPPTPAPNGSAGSERVGEAWSSVPMAPVAPRVAAPAEPSSERTMQSLVGVRAGGADLPRSHAKASGRNIVVPTRTEAAVEAQIARGLSAAVRQRGGTVTLRLSPESLGLVRVEVRVAEGQVRVRMEANTDSARRLLGDHLAALRQALEDQGLRVDRIEVARPRDAAEDGATDGRNQHGERGRSGEDAQGREGYPGRRGGAQAGQDPAHPGRRSSGVLESGGARVEGGADDKSEANAGDARERSRPGVDVIA
jgi:hypothetical protein